ncbi:MAG: class I SAM-dependent methyltransferase family protein [Thaumarchaeota archaeon]|nr:class I SAM-dependent methyltransferase family protein [Nitrososphaerota archaeon]
MLKRVLTGILSEDESSQLISSFDTIGDIAIVKVPDIVIRKKEDIAMAILQNVKHIHTVLRQIGPVTGEYRVRGLEYLAGEHKTTTLHKEHGCVFEVDLSKVYFSPRLSEERNRIAALISGSDQTNVVNMFSGVGPFSILIAKGNPNATIYSIESNPYGYELMIRNSRLNRVEGKVISIFGDCVSIVKENLVGVGDHVLMPLPEESPNYLGSAVLALKPRGGIIHYYRNIKQSDNMKFEIEDELASHISRPWEVMASRIVSDVGPGWVQIVADVKVKGAS